MTLTDYAPMPSSSVSVANRGQFVVREPMYVTAWVDGLRLTVYRSPIVLDHDPLYREVADFLATHEHEELFTTTEIDLMMMLGQAIVTTFKLL